MNIKTHILAIVIMVISIMSFERLAKAYFDKPAFPEPTSLKRGEQVLIELPDQTANPYRDCDFYYITSIEAHPSPTAFVAIKNCPFQKDDPLEYGEAMTEMIPLEFIRVKKN